MNVPARASIGDTSPDDDSSGNGKTVAPTGYHLTDAEGPLDPEELRLLDAWWRAANYLSVGQIYLMDNPLLRRPLAPEDVKPRLLGHWGTTPGLNLIYAHANRAIRRRDLNACYVMGPGHGGPGPNACAWLEGTYTERYSSIRQDEVGMQSPVSAVFFPWWSSLTRRSEHAGFIPRGRRTRILPTPRLRSGPRPPGPDGLLRRR